MSRSLDALNAKSIREVLEFCNHAATSSKITAAFVRTDYASLSPAPKTIAQILTVVRDFPPRLMNYVKSLDSRSFSILMADQWVFERDVDRGFLGEALAGGLIFPYSPLSNDVYLHSQETKLKKRLITELLESLVLDFPELSYDLHVDPKYFMYETMLTRGRLFPPTLYALANLMNKNKHEGGLQCAFLAFLEALGQLKRDGIVDDTNGYVRISKEFVDRVRAKRIRFTDLFRTGQRALFSTVLGIFPQVLDAMSQNLEAFSRLQRTLADESRIMQNIEDPENYVYIPTASGLVSLTNRIDIKSFARKALSTKKDTEVKIKNMGGILNDVYLVELQTETGCRKVVVKRFRDWSDFKWFPITLWSIGTRTFAMAGDSRLEKELAINRLLDSHGFAVPKLLHVNPTERMIVMDYVEGEDLSKTVKRLVSSKSADEVIRYLDVIAKVGGTLAQVHSLSVALGDTKPENILIGKHAKVYLTDFEQASRKGDPVWDIAEFLYYSGHYVSPLTEIDRIQLFGETFVKGYLRANGRVSVVKKASSPKYTKVFSIFTFPHIMFALTNVCRKADELMA